MTPSDWRGRLAPAAVATAALVATLGAFGPFDVYSGNVAEFPVAFGAAARHLVLPGFGAWLVLTAVLLISGRRSFEWAIALVLGLGFGAYAQGKWLVWDYGLLDGRVIPWGDYGLRSALDLSLWLVVLGLVGVYRARVAARALGLATLLMAVQFASAMPAWLAPDGAPSAPKPATALDSIHRYSADRNVVVVLLDGFQSTAFAELEEAQPEWRRVFDGFTWFEDTVAPFPTTRLALPAILSGALYDNRETMAAFLSRVLPDRSLPSRLHAEGFLVDLTTRSRFCDLLAANSCAELAPLVERDPARLERSTLVSLLDVSLFRQAPQPLKRLLFADQNWLLRSRLLERPGPRFHVESIEFVEAVEANARLGSGAPTFKLIHLFVPHLPVRLAGDCTHTDSAEGNTTAGYTAQARCALELTRRLLTVFEEIGVYDQSMIVVLADHGVDLAWDLPHPPDFPNPGPALPLLLVKPFGARGALVRSDAPASLIDVPATIAAGLERRDRFPGRSLLGPRASEPRRRVHRDYEWKRSNWWGLQIDHMQEYEIVGPAADGANWRRGQPLPAAGVR